MELLDNVRDFEIEYQSPFSSAQFIGVMQNTDTIESLLEQNVSKT